jgi:hypothetical protein
LAAGVANDFCLEGFMKIIRCLTVGVSILALAVAASGVGNASAREIHYPTKMGAARIDPNTPLKRIGPYEPPYRAPGKTTSGTWTDVATALPFTNGPWGPMLFTDGTVIIEDFCTSPAQWYKLTPNNKGNYARAAWSKIAAMPSGYSPLYFAQQVLPDGRVIINGGEYNNCSADWTKCADGGREELRHRLQRLRNLRQVGRHMESRRQDSGLSGHRVWRGAINARGPGRRHDHPVHRHEQPWCQRRLFGCERQVEVRPRHDV